MRVALIVLLLVAAVVGPASADPEGTLTWGLHVTLAARWLDPGDTEAFINPFMVLYAVHDALVKPMPAGDNTPNTGHHHLLIDGRPIPKGDVIPASERSLHFGKAQTETDINLPPGQHTLTLQLGDGIHRSYGPELSSTITINVK